MSDIQFFSCDNSLSDIRFSVLDGFSHGVSFGQISSNGRGEGTDYTANWLLELGGAFPTVCLKTTSISGRSFIPQCSRIGDINQHIVTLLPKKFGSTCQSIIQETEIQILA